MKDTIRDIVISALDAEDAAQAWKAEAKTRMAKAKKLAKAYTEALEEDFDFPAFVASIREETSDSMNEPEYETQADPAEDFPQE